MPSQPKRKPSGIETRPGLSSGNQWKSTPWIIDGLRPMVGTTGLPEKVKRISGPLYQSAVDRSTAHRRC